jgi:hypothetical protein
MIDKGPPMPPASEPVVVSDPRVTLDAAATLFLTLQAIVRAEPATDKPAEVDEQLRAYSVLRAVNQFVSRAWLDANRVEVQRYLLDLAARFSQLEGGVRHRMFEAQPPGRSGAMPDTFEIWEARKFVCAAVECLKRGGASRAAAAKAIAGKQANKCLKRLIRGAHEQSADKATSEDLCKAIISWHKLFQSGDALGPIQATWPHMLEIISRNGDAPREICEAMEQVSLEKARVAARKVFLKPDPQPIA